MKLRRRAVLKWTGAGLCALIFVAWLLSLWFDLAVTHIISASRTWVADLNGGRLLLMRQEDSRVDVFASEGWSAQMVAVRHHWPPRRSYWRLLPRAGESFEFPLWLPGSLVAAATCWLFYADHQKRGWAREGRCVMCGYDLSGLPPGGACPECGKGVAA